MAAFLVSLKVEGAIFFTTDNTEMYNEAIAYHVTVMRERRCS